MLIQQAGSVGNYTVIEAAGRTITELLSTEMENHVSITIASPGEDYGVPLNNNGGESNTSRVNLFLYRIGESPFSRNNDWVNTGEGFQMPYPLTLNLFYMLNIFTPDKSSNLDEHRILGDVMRVFHANQIVDPIYFEGILNPNESQQGLPWEEFKITHHPLSLEELAAIWHAIDKPYRLSVAYEVSVVMIAPPVHKSRRIRRVEVTNVRAVPFKGIPVIEKIEPEQGHSGDMIKIYGERFNSQFVKVYLNESQISPINITETKIEFHLPDRLSPGLYYIMVSNEEGSSEPIRFEEISPFLYRLDPEIKYKEDNDFPKIEGNPVLTIYGGNFNTDLEEMNFIAKLENGTENQISILKENVTKNSIIWNIPVEIIAGKTELRLKQGTSRISNMLIFEIPNPHIYRVDPDIILKSDLGKTEISITGDYFRKDNTDVYLHKGKVTNNIDLVVTDIIPSTIKNERQINCKLSNDLIKGEYSLVVRVYGKYFSLPYVIDIK